MPTTTRQSTGARNALAPPAVHPDPTASAATGSAVTTSDAVLNQANIGVRERGEARDPYAEYVRTVFKGSLAAIGVTLLHAGTSFVIDKVAPVGAASASAPLIFLHQSLDLLGSIGIVGSFAVLVVAEMMNLARRAIWPRRAQ